MRSIKGKLSTREGKPMATQTAKRTRVTSIASITDSVFEKSFRDGALWALQGDLVELSDEIIVQFVRDNILGEAFDYPMDEADITGHVAFLVGWLLNARE